MKFDSLGWLDEAVEIDYLNKSMDRQGYAIKYIVLHGTAGGSSAQAIGEYFRDSDVDASAHFVIGQDGTIVQGVNVLAAAWGNGVLTAGHASYFSENINPNLLTVSIEHVKPSTDNSDQLTTIQAQKSFELIQCLCDTYNIPKHAGDASGGVISHADIDPINRSRCPGPYDWNGLWQYLAQGDSMVPLGWKDSGATLTAPNGHTVTLGFRDYILNHNWEPGDWPLEEAHAQDPLELSNPGLGHGTIQTFRKTVLEWTPTKDVFESWVGQELLALRAKLAQNVPSTPIVTINTQAAISSLQAVSTALQSMESAVLAVIKDLEPS
jgi:hypothetical protein